MLTKKRSTQAVDAPAPAMRGMADAEQATIELNQVSKWYGDIVAVSDISFGVGPGVTGLLGPNGAGKSTTLKMMAGLQAPSSGKVLINGVPARENPATY